MRLDIGVIEHATQSCIPPLVAEYQKHHPNVEIELYDLFTPQQIEALLRGDIQVGFVTLFKSQEIDTRIARKAIFEEGNVVLLPSSHPLIERDWVSFADLKSQPLVLYARDVNPAYYDLIIRCCKREKYRPKIVQEVSLTHTLLASVGSGAGIGIAPENAKNISAPGVETRILNVPDMALGLWMIWLDEEPAEPLNTFLNIAQNFNQSD